MNQPNFFKWDSESDEFISINGGKELYRLTLPNDDTMIVYQDPMEQRIAVVLDKNGNTKSISI